MYDNFQCTPKTYKLKITHTPTESPLQLWPATHEALLYVFSLCPPKTYKRELTHAMEFWMGSDRRVEPRSDTPARPAP
ncbi:hypothetical protein A8H37_31875 [Burkholderia thailandensis]|nr:hypothetical protein A8H37_31875 [Burkholderia thailandensis]